MIPLLFFFKTLFAPHPQDRQRMHRSGQTHELHNLCEAATPRDGGFLRTPRDPKRIKHVKVPLDIAMVLKNNYGATLIWIYLSKNILKTVFSFEKTSLIAFFQKSPCFFLEPIGETPRNVPSWRCWSCHLHSKRHRSVTICGDLELGQTWGISGQKTLVPSRFMESRNIIPLKAGKMIFVFKWDMLVPWVAYKSKRWLIMTHPVNVWGAVP